MLYEIFKAYYGKLFGSTTHEEFWVQVHPMLFAGFLVAGFAVFYAVLSWKIRKKESENID